MGCDIATGSDGETWFICMSDKEEACECGRPATLLCDGPGARRGGTCDEPICDACSTRLADNVSGKIDPLVLTTARRKPTTVGRAKLQKFCKEAVAASLAENDSIDLCPKCAASQPIVPSGSLRLAK